MFKKKKVLFRGGGGVFQLQLSYFSIFLLVAFKWFEFLG